jgi:hypothetical protein
MVCNMQKVMRFQAFPNPVLRRSPCVLSLSLSASQIGLTECTYGYGQLTEGEISGSKTAWFRGRGVLARAGLIGLA